MRRPACILLLVTPFLVAGFPGLPDQTSPQMAARLENLDDFEAKMLSGEEEWYHRMATPWEFGPAFASGYLASPLRQLVERGEAEPGPLALAWLRGLRKEGEHLPVVVTDDGEPQTRSDYGAGRCGVGWTMGRLLHDAEWSEVRLRAARLCADPRRGVDGLFQALTLCLSTDTQGCHRLQDVIEDWGGDTTEERRAAFLAAKPWTKPTLWPDGPAPWRSDRCAATVSAWDSYASPSDATAEKLGAELGPRGFTVVRKDRIDDGWTYRDLCVQTDDGERAGRIAAVMKEVLATGFEQRLSHTVWASPPPPLRVEPATP